MGDELSAQALFRDRRFVLNNNYGNTNIVWAYLNVTDDNGEPQKLLFAYPFRLLETWNNVSGVGAGLFYQYLSGKAVEIILYMDECWLGNSLLPNKGRSLHNI